MEVGRLIVQLNRTNLQSKDQPLYQLLKQLILGLEDTATTVSTIGSSTNSGGNTVSSIITTLLGNNGIGQSPSGITGLTPIPNAQGNFTPGSVIFAGANGQLSQNNSKFFWDITNQRHGIGTTTPNADLEVVGLATTVPVFIARGPDSPTQQIIEIRSQGGGFFFKNAANSVQYAFLIGGGTSALSSLTGGLRIGTNTGDGLIIQENGGITYLGGLLKFAGDTSSFPMFKRSSAELHAKLGDDSAFATFRAEILFANQAGGGAAAGAIQIGPLPSGPQFGGIWIGQASPSSSNYSFLGNSGGTPTTLFNTPTGGTLQFRVNNATFFAVNNTGVTINGGSGNLPTIPLSVRNASGSTVLATLDDSGNLDVLLRIKSSSPTAGVGYATGAGGTIAQLTNKATGVTLNKITGLITMNNANLAAATAVSFTLTDSAIAATDTIIMQHDSAGTPGAYLLTAQPATGSAVITVTNITAGGLAEAIVLRFTVIKSVSA